ncbi:MAG: CheR family methyltransferase, partial [Candidatus Hodarchaeota archaeon]
MSSKKTKEPIINSEQIELVRKLLKKSGFNLSYQDKHLRRRLSHRMQKLECTSLMSYYSILNKNMNELEALKNALSINVTEFFRNTKMYRTFQDLITQYINNVVDRKETPSIRIWSAGCATGAEPYSIAITLAEALKKSISNYDIRIFGTDFNHDLLNVARIGIYEEEVLKNVPNDIKLKYFNPLNNTKYQVLDPIKKLVEFSYLDLTASSFPFKRLDVIFCRNVFI